MIGQRVMRASAVGAEVRRVGALPRTALPDVDAAELARVAHEAAVAEGRAKGLAEGRAQGRAEGLAQGLEEGRFSGEEKAAHEASRLRAAERAEAVALRKRWQDLIEAFSKACNDWPAQQEDVLAELALAAVGHCVAQCVASPEGIRELVRRLLEQQAAHDAVKVLVHPDDLAIVMSACESREPMPACEADEHVGAGGCIVVTSSGQLDARLDTMLDEIRAAVRQARQARGAGA